MGFIYVIYFVSFLFLTLLLRYLYRGVKKYNYADWGHGWLNILDGINRLFCYKYHRLNTCQIKLPTSGCAIVAGNHVSGLDPLLLIAASPRPLRFLIAREQYERFGLRWLFRATGCIPVEREARPERAFREALRHLQRGEIIAIFPHGKIHLDSDPPRSIKAGVIKLAEMSGCYVYPARLEGIRGQGLTLLSVPLRSHATVTVFPPLYCDGENSRDHLQDLAAYIEGRALSTSPAANL